MLAIAIVILLCYVFLIGKFAFALDKVPDVLLQDIPAKTKFSVIIPFRNEAENLPTLLKSIKTLNYPNSYFEVILVDDASEDQSVEVIQNWLNQNGSDLKNNLSILKNERLTHSPKKDAITTAIQIAKHDWIITTDADCVLPKYWLDSFDSFIQQQAVKIIAGPVTYHNHNGFLKQFQLLDFLSLTGTTIAGFGMNLPFLCNGANLAYKKSFFKSVNGFEGNTGIASGDDIFLLEKALQTDKKSVKFLKSKQAIVLTKPESTWRGLINQRVRWASKTSNYKNNFAKLVGLLVLLANALLVIGFVLMVFGLFHLKTFGYLCVLKFLIDFLLIYKTSVFFNKETALAYFLPSSILYPFFSVYVAFISLFSTYKWKNRRFKK